MKKQQPLFDTSTYLVVTSVFYRIQSNMTISLRLDARKFLLMIFLLSLLGRLSVSGFSSASTKNKQLLLPKYDSTTQKWIPTGPNQLPDSGYPPSKTLLLQGPKPFLTRIFQSDDYEQAVLKFMAGDNVTSRDKAQGNMDAYLRNPQDWMYNRMQSQQKGFEIDYTRLEVKDIVLVSVWSIIVFAIIGRVAYSAIVLGTGPFAL
jgi:hypothetical protein